MKKILPALVAGFAAGVLHVVPITKALTCCLVIPFAAYFAVVLEAKSLNHIGDFSIKRGAMLGVLTGIFAALFGSFFDIFITFITKNNDILNAFNDLTLMIDSFPVSQEVKTEVVNLLKVVTDSIRESGFSLLYSISIILNNFVVDIIFGLIGGLVGTKIFNSRKTRIQK